MPIRRPHVKSRHGCVPCKRARVKCDQVHPICSKCVRFGRPCEYLLLPNSDQSARPALSTPPSSTGNLPSPSLDQHASVGSTTDITFGDLALMHFYTVATCHTLDPRPDLREIFQVFIPQEGASHPCLMHSLLAMAALHQISLGTDHYERLLTSAIKHHNLALAKSKLEMEQYSERNCDALFAFSAMIAISVLALPVCRNVAGLQDPIHDIAQAAILMRGSSTIVQTGFQWLEIGRFRPLLRLSFVSEKPDLPEDIEAVFNQLAAQIKSTSSLEKDLVACRSALERLEMCFRKMRFSPGNNKIPMLPEDRGVIWSWLATIDVDFITLISRGNPMALVLLAHYAVLLHALDEVWWCKGWGMALMKSILQSVNKEWQQSLIWPTRRIGLDML